MEADPEGDGWKKRRDELIEKARMQPKKKKKKY